MEAALFGPSGRTILGPTVVTIGRELDNQLVINDPLVSAHHAEIRPERQGYCILDLGSTNHTFINEYQLTPNIPRSLNSGDNIRLGKNVVYLYKVSGVSPGTRTVRADATVLSNPAQFYSQSAASAGPAQGRQLPSPPNQQKQQNRQQQQGQQQPIAKKKKGGLSKLQWIITGVAVPIIVALITGGFVWHNGTTSSIPLLHTSYNGSSVSLMNSSSTTISIFNLSEDANTGYFTANMKYDICVGMVTNGMVSQSGKVTFTFDQQANSYGCTAVEANFTGQLNSVGAIIGNWNEPNGSDNGSFNIS